MKSERIKQNFPSQKELKKLEFLSFKHFLNIILSTLVKKKWFCLVDQDFFQTVLDDTPYFPIFTTFVPITHSNVTHLNNICQSLSKQPSIKCEKDKTSGISLSPFSTLHLLFWFSSYFSSMASTFDILFLPHKNGALMSEQVPLRKPRWVFVL